jgi:hypothetical protein
MADQIIAESESGAVFVECLGIPKRLTSANDSAEPNDRRAMAVACALELIKVSVAAGANLGSLLDNLDDYANLIESALETE